MRTWKISISLTRLAQKITGTFKVNYIILKDLFIRLLGTNLLLEENLVSSLFIDICHLDVIRIISLGHIELYVITVDSGLQETQ